MKRAHGTYKASKVATEDDISDLPEDVTSHIFYCLPIKDAVRTGILTRNWRFKWTNISKLVFDEKFFEPGPDGRNRNNCNESAITRLLLHLRTAVTKFVICIPDHKILDVEEVNHWVLMLSRKGIREFAVVNNHTKSLKLPSHLFSCLELKILKLRNCYYHVPPTFSGFPNLLNLDFLLVENKSRNIGEFISWCPSLKILKLCNFNLDSGKVKSYEIRKLKNLEVLSLRLHHLELIAIKSSEIFRLAVFLPKLQELLLDFQYCELAAGRKVGAVFPCLKRLTLYSIDFGSYTMLSCAFDMICGSPNLQNLTVNATSKDVVAPPSLVSSLDQCFEVQYTRMRKLRLKRALFAHCRGSEAEVYLIKCILACSPSLEMVGIFPEPFRGFIGGEKGKLMFASKLLELPRASAIAVMRIYWSNLDI